MSFVPDVATLVQFAIATAVIAITPGPDMTLFVGRTLSQGRAAGFACMAGAMTGILVHTSLVAVGLSALIVASPEAFLVLKTGGAGYLLWLAWQAVRHGSAFSPEKQAGGSASLMRNWAKGIAINLLNPKIILFFMTFLPQFVSAHDPQAPGKLVFLGLLFILVSLPVTVPLVFMAHGFSQLLRRTPTVTRVIDYVFAGIFTAFAVKILTTQVR